MKHKKIHWAKEHYWEIDYKSLQENMWDEASISWLISKMWEELTDEIKDRIKDALIDNE
jgi:hypothetical protein